MIKNVKKKGRVQHLPYSCLQTSLEWREPREKMKYKEFSANTVAFISCRCRLTKVLAVATRGHFSLPHPYFLFFPSRAPANTLVSLHLQLMKATVLAESIWFYLFFLYSLHSAAVCRHESDRCRSFFPFLTYFLSYQSEEVTCEHVMQKVLPLLIHHSSSVEISSFYVG